MNRAAIRQEAHDRASMALDIARGRRQGDQVIGVDNALSQADDQAGANERAAKQQQRGALAVGAAGANGDDQKDCAHHQRSGQQPRHRVDD